jgi:CheY-like chemotaxis protein
VACLAYFLPGVYFDVVGSLLFQGIGLFLCKNLVALMDGEILLDEDYDSGIKGCPGTRFIVNLKQPPIDPHLVHEYHSHSATNGTGETYLLDSEDDDEEEDSVPKDLPPNLSVLFVDDDPILRKLFSRTVQTVVPGWKVREAANGETALRLVDTEHFDLIFMDMYMASVEKQLLGTETVQALRNKGVTCRICGLSANDKEREFLKAGANVFTFKPFPCESRALTNELCRVLCQDDTTAEPG